MKSLLRLHGLGCGADTLSLLNAEEPELLTALEMLDVQIVWHPSLSLKQGPEVREILTAFLDGKRALIGTRIADETNPVKIQHVVRSYDPCLVCTVH